MPGHWRCQVGRCKAVGRAGPLVGRGSARAGRLAKVAVQGRSRPVASHARTAALNSFPSRSIHRSLRPQRSRRVEKCTVIMGIFIGGRFGHLGANPVIASGETRTTGEKDPPGKKQDKDQGSQNRHLRGPACSKHRPIYRLF
jgi:hypothetical protein